MVNQSSVEPLSIASSPQYSYLKPCNLYLHYNNQIFLGVRSVADCPVCDLYETVVADSRTSSAFDHLAFTSEGGGVN